MEHHLVVIVDILEIAIAFAVGYNLIATINYLSIAFAYHDDP